MVSANNSINDTVGASISGVTNTFTITNGSNTASSQAKELITVGGGTAGDPWIHWEVNGVTDWSVGIDNDDSDKWKLSEASSIGTNDTIVAHTTNGQVVMPRQSSFVAYNSVNETNVTGDGTIYVAQFDSTQTNVGSDFDTATGLYTAPVDGIYFFEFSAFFGGLTSSHTAGAVWVSGAPSNAPGNAFNAANARDASNRAVFIATGIKQMTAGDTAYALVRVAGGSKVVDLLGVAGGIDVTWFRGCLLH